MQQSNSTNPEVLIDWPSFNLGQKRMLEQGYIKLPSKEQVIEWLKILTYFMLPRHKIHTLYVINSFYQHLGEKSLFGEK